MGMEKAIASRKEHRKPYQGGKSIDKTCRNHGGCPCCLSNRTHKYEVTKLSAKSKEDCYEQDI